jgi:methionine--tRNA ligase beta chain
MAKVSYEDFVKLDFRIGKVITAERIKDSKKLLKLKIDVGGEERQSIAGLANEYEPENLKNRLVSIIVNLEPRKVFGEISEVMLLAAVENEKVSLLVPDKEVLEGSRIS